MTSQNLAMRTAGSLFALMGMAQVWRLVVRPGVYVGGHEMPLWPSMIAVVLLAGMSFWMFVASATSGGDGGANKSD